MTATLQPPQTPDNPRTRRSRRPVERSRGLRPRHLAGVVGLLVGAAVMLVVAALGEMRGTRVPVLSTLAEAPVGDNNPRLIAPRPLPDATPGSCLTWRRPDAADAEIVDCAKQHLFEQAGAVQLTDAGGGNTLPDNQKFRQLVNDRCTPLVISYLGGKYDPNGAFRAGALKPSAKRWAEGDRSLRCGLQRFSRSGALYPISGKIAAQDQADIRPAGTCLGVDGRFIGDPVDCALPHAVESVGSIDLGEKFKDKFPSENDQDEFLQPACTKLASDYAGGTKNISDKKLSVIWSSLRQESWDGGTRRVACILAAQLPDKSGYAPITGSVKGPVVVGDRPAPPARRSVPPGAPARPGATEPGPPLDSAPPSETLPEEPIPLPDRAERPPPPVEPPPSSQPAPFRLPEDKLPKDQLPNDPLPPVLQRPGGGRPGQDRPGGDRGNRPGPVVPNNPLGR
ncbi:MAG: septum formation family protein [Pseudonocardia sp.]